MPCSHAVFMASADVTTMDHHNPINAFTPREWKARRIKSQMLPQANASQLSPPQDEL